jgi:hypothetical protein
VVYAVQQVVCRLITVTAGGGGYSNAVDLYNSVSGTWSTAQLSAARFGLAATSVGNLAIFAGGETSNFLDLRCVIEGSSCCLRIMLVVGRVVVAAVS